MTKRGRPSKTTKTFPMRMEPDTYAELQWLAQRTNLSLGAALGHLVNLGSPLLLGWHNMSTGMLGDDIDPDEVFDALSKARKLMHQIRKASDKNDPDDQTITTAIS